MFGKRSRLEHLDTQRQILLAESELNRIHLLQDLERLHSELRQLSRIARAAASITSSVAKAGTFVLFARRLLHGFRSGSDTAPAKSSFITKLLKGITAGFSFWETLRPRP